MRFHIAMYWKVHREHEATMHALRQAALVNEEFRRKLNASRRDQATDLPGWPRRPLR